jgi:UDP-3-O-[3-hydroxymyristoyl] glucosamine N-acyltransferase
LTHRPPPPQQLLARARSLSSLAERYGLDLVGPDREIRSFGGTTTRLRNRQELLTWASGPSYVDAFAASDIAACVVAADARDAIPGDRSALVAADDPAEAFYAIFCDAVEDGDWSHVPSGRGDGAEIASTAIIGEHVSLGTDCVIMDHVVIMPETHIGDRVMIKPNTTIGGQGFQLARVAGRRRMIPHAGGVVIGADATIGSSTCVDRGLFGEMTWIGERTHVDNLVHIAHSAFIGCDSTVVAAAEVSGSAIVGDGVWLAPHSAVSHGVRIGDHVMMGIGAVATRDVPAHAVAVGVPARVMAWQCMCGSRIAPDHGAPSSCPACGRRYEFTTGQPVLFQTDDG